MLSSLQEAALFLVEVSFEFYIMMLVLRLVLHLIGADYYHPLCQFVAKLTRPVIAPMQRFFPIVKNIDLSVVALIIVLEMLKVSLVFLIKGEAIHHTFGLLVYAFGDFLDQIVTIYFYGILLQIIMSWVRPSYNPMIDILYRITNPLMHPVQRILPPVGGIDISPIPVMLGLKLFEIMVTYPMIRVGQGLALMP